jgi:hypothetical protein
MPRQYENELMEVMVDEYQVLLGFETRDWITVLYALT